MNGKNYRDLIAWQKAMDLVEHVYRVTLRDAERIMYPDDPKAYKGCPRTTWRGGGAA